MYLKFRIIFTILSVVCVAALLPVGSFFGLGWAGLCAVLALLFFGLMMLCKQNQAIEECKQQREEKKNEQNAQNPENK